MLTKNEAVRPCEKKAWPIRLPMANPSSGAVFRALEAYQSFPSARLMLLQVQFLVLAEICQL